MNNEAKLKAVQAGYAGICSDEKKEKFLAENAAIYSATLSRCIKILGVDEDWKNDPVGFEYASILTKLYIVKTKMVYQKVKDFLSGHDLPLDMVQELADEIAARSSVIMVDDSWVVTSDNIFSISEEDSFAITVAVNHEEKKFTINAIVLNELFENVGRTTNTMFEAPRTLH